MNKKTVKLSSIFLSAAIFVTACSGNSGSSNDGGTGGSDFPCETARITIQNGDASQTLIDNFNRECS